MVHSVIPKIFQNKLLSDIKTCLVLYKSETLTVKTK